MTRILRLLSLLSVCCALTARAQNTVFNAALTGDVLNPATYPAVTPTTTGWDVLSNKAAPAPTESGGVLTINMAGTTSGFVETQALFAAAPVQLLPGTYLELTTTFTPTNILTTASDNLIVGLFNSGGTAPLSGLLNSGLSNGLTTFTTGGAKGWLGYSGNIPLTGASPKMLNRAAQTAANNTVQDVLVDSQSTSVGYSAPAGTNASSIGPISTTLTNGSTYTLDYKLSLSADGLTLTSAVSLYNGAGTTGTGSNTLIGSNTGRFTGAAVLTKAFNALALGWRADAGTASPSNLKISALSVKTTGGTPWFTTQPPTSVLVSIGSDLNLTAVVAGIVAGYQWQVSTDGGATFSNLDPVANPSAATTTLTIANVQNSTAGLYRLVATNAAGSTASTACTVSVSAFPVAPSIVTNPASATALGGTPQSFSVTVNGTSPLSYQWQKSTDGVTFAPIAGATSATYTIPAVSLSDEGYYNVIVTNVAGSATSATAQLTVDQPLTITVQPVGAAISLGGSYTLSVTAVGRPAPTYQWYLNGTAISGATSSTYPIASATAANAGIYTVVASNTTGDSVTSSGAAVAVLSPTLASTALTPTATPTGIAPDTRLTLTFNQPVSVGLMGTIKIYDASNSTTPVDTIDLVAGTALMKTLRAASTLSTLALPVQNKTVGGLTNFNYYPITVSGNTATIYPRNNVLTYGKTYFVTVDSGVFTDSTGLSYAGITGSSGWTFSTEAASPSSGATQFVVAADGSGDFYTVQGALDFIPSGNTTPRTIFLRRGTYFEQVYFTGKHSITFLGEDRVQSVIVYPNNNNFNNVSGSYHRMTFQADHVNNVALVNLSVTNSTPKGGSQAEAVILNGTNASQGIISNVTLFSFQDTLQINGQAYVTDSHISGDVDFMWGSGPCFFNNCELTQLTSAAYFTQIRNGSGNHGFVYSNCRFDAPAGITGAFLGRIDPGAFPTSEVVVLDSKIGDATNNAFLATATGVSGANYLAGWWLLNNAASAAAAPTVHNWTNSLVNGNGAALTNPNSDAFTTMPTDATTQANYRSVPWVLGTSLGGTVFSSWTPALAPLIATPPVAQTINAGSGFTLSVQAFGLPALTYQWLLNGVPIPGATSASYTVASSGSTDAGTYSVVVSNGSASVTTTAVSLLVHGAPPVIALPPANTSGLLGTTATFNAWAQGDTPFSYQWLKNGVPITGATNQSLRLTGLQASDAASYAVAVTNAGGTTTTASATLTIVAPATTVPTLPQIPAVVFDVTAYGAVGDGATDNTVAIQAAINAAKAAGGGTIELPPAGGAYLCGPITLGSHLDLQVDAGATLRALPFGVYPNSTTSPAHFITISSGSTDVEFSGGGTIDGDGTAWWAAFNAGTISNRPRLVQITKTTNMLYTGVTLLNSPNFHFAFSGANNNTTLFGITISASGTSPNTDGMDLAGSNFLVQNCSVSDGDDNIVAKPGSVFCRNIYIANCAFGTGHGVSIGGQTNVGLDGMTVTNCTFNGTSTALRFKADPTEGGPVQNVTFSNLTMTNVQYPILFYSYYNLLGSPGGTSGSSQITPAKVNTYNAVPPSSLASTTIPTWRNITVSNLTVINGSGYSTIWGLPLANALIANVTLNNVNIQGGAGLELYDATNIQFTGSNSVGPIITDNALAITGQPAGQTVNVGGSVTFSVTAVGGSGTNNTGLTYQWNLNDAPLTDGVQADGSTVTGSATATLAIANTRVTGAGNYTVTVSTTLDGYNTGTNTLVANSLPVNATSAAAVLTVNPLPASIALSNLTQTYDGTVKAPTVVTSPMGLGVQVAYDGGATPLNAGSYPLTVTVTDPNYLATPAGGTLLIAPASLAVAADPQSKVYGSADPALTYTVSGLQASDTAAGVLTGALTRLAGESVAGSPYDIQQGTLTANTNYVISFTDANLTITTATASISVQGFAGVYDGRPHGATGTATGVNNTDLSGLLALGASFTNVPGGTAIWAFHDSAGNYSDASGSVAITIGKAAATVAVTPYAITYDGNAHTAIGTATGVSGEALAGLDLSGTTHTAAGTYSDPWTFTDATGNYNNASATVSDSIARAKATIVVTPYSVTYDGNAHTATGSVRGVKGEPLAGLSLAGTTHTNAGTYTDTWTFTDVTGNYNNASATITDQIGIAAATITLAPLAQMYDGQPKPVTATTTPAGLTVTITYNGSSTAPTLPGSYTVVATIVSGNYAGTQSVVLTIGITALVRHGPTLDGDIDGSLQVLTGENITLNGNAGISGDLLVPGLPTLRLNGRPTFAGVQDSVGAATPTNYTVTLNGNSLLRYLVRRVDPLALPTVAVPDLPKGTRSVTMNRSTDPIGAWSTLKDLTLNSNVGNVTVPAGVYGSFIANGGSGFTLGVAGATTPSVYEFQRLTLNGNAALNIVGPVIIVLKNDLNVNGGVGAVAHPEWLDLRVSNGSVTLNGNVAFHGYVTAPSGTVTINGNTTLTGGVAADRLVINGNGTLVQPTN